MSFLGLERRKASKQEIADLKAFSSMNNGWSGFYPALLSRDKPMVLSAVYRCVDILSSNVAQLKMGVMKIDSDGYPSRDMTHPADRLIYQDPNQDMSAYNFKRALVVSMLLRGRGLGYILRNSKGYPQSITYVPVESASTVWVMVGGARVRRYKVTGFEQLVDPKDMIDVLNFSENGQDGQSTISFASNTIGISLDSEQKASDFFQSGAGIDGVLTVDGHLKPEQKAAIREDWAKIYGSNAVDRSSIAVLEGNTKFQGISISPKDAQLLESRQFNVLEICRFFGVPPSKVFDTTNKSYNSQEAEQLDFLNSSLSPLIANIEEEFNRKIFASIEYGKYRCEFDLSNLIRADKTTQASYYNTLFQIGAITPNEIRKKLGEDRIQDGDKSFVQVNVQTLEQAVNKQETNNE